MTNKAPLTMAQRQKLQEEHEAEMALRDPVILPEDKAERKRVLVGQLLSTKPGKALLLDSMGVPGVKKP